jgi:hypothetical protein
MACRYCGLQAGGGANHAQIHDCITALQTETDRLRTIIERFAADSSEEPRRALTATVALLAGSAPEAFVIVVEREGVERAIGPFNADECRSELAALHVPPAAIEARLARARRVRPVE